MKVVKRILIVVFCLILLIAVLVGGYIAYLMIQYNRIADYAPLDVLNNQQMKVQTGVPYTATTYNIGFGAYDPGFSFFMDTGEMLDGTKTKGVHGKAVSKQVVELNTAGAVQVINELNPDFMLFQEVDTNSDRSWHLDQSETIRTAFPGHGSLFASNFHSGFLAYPFNDMHGTVNAGVLTLSRFEVARAARRSFPVDESFPEKFFDLDRCFTVTRIPVEEGAELVLINLHMSAYDKGGTIRAEQLAMLLETFKEERAKGNWIVAGGDFNHAISNTINSFPSGQKVPDWVFALESSDLPEGIRIVDAENANLVATCRSSDIPYQPGVNYLTVVDGFMVSDNVMADARNIDAGFLYSDHNPVLLTFSLMAPAEEPQPEPEQPAVEEAQAEEPQQSAAE